MSISDHIEIVGNMFKTKVIEGDPAHRVIVNTDKVEVHRASGIYRGDLRDVPRRRETTLVPVDTATLSLCDEFSAADLLAPG